MSKNFPRLILTVVGYMVIFVAHIVSFSSATSIKVSVDPSLMDQGNCGSESCTRA